MKRKGHFLKISLSLIQTHTQREGGREGGKEGGGIGFKRTEFHRNGSYRLIETKSVSSEGRLHGFASWLCPYETLFTLSMSLTPGGDSVHGPL